MPALDLFIAVEPATRIHFPSRYTPSSTVPMPTLVAPGLAGLKMTRNPVPAPTNSSGPTATTMPYPFSALRPKRSSRLISTLVSAQIRDQGGMILVQGKTDEAVRPLMGQHERGDLGHDLIVAAESWRGGRGNGELLGAAGRGNSGRSIPNGESQSSCRRRPRETGCGPRPAPVGLRNEERIACAHVPSAELGELRHVEIWASRSRLGAPSRQMSVTCGTGPPLG